MTALVPATGTAVATQDEAPAQPVGLEDFEETGLSLPRYTIVGRTDTPGPLMGKSVFRNKQAGVELEMIDAIVLGSIKSRVLWPPEMGEGEAASIPLCKSLDYHVGRPDLGDADRTPPRAGAFPWKAVPPEFKASMTEEGTVKCADCPLKEWGSHPTQDKPWCSAQDTWLIQFESGEGALLTFQRSGLAPVTNYEKGFAATKTKKGEPMFTVRTIITLEQRTRGTVTYGVPVVRRGEVTAMGEWPAFESEYAQVRAYLHTPRAPREEESTTAVVAADPATPAFGVTSTGDDLPF